MRSVALRWVVACAALAGAGCTSLIPPYERPAAPVPASYPPEPAPPPAGEAAADIDWQRFFADPRLKRLIALALANNRDLRVAVLNIEQTRALYQVRRADELPTVGVGAIGDAPARRQRQSSPSYAVGFAVSSYELDLFGRVPALSEAALAQYFATAEGAQGGADQPRLVGRERLPGGARRRRAAARHARRRSPRARSRTASPSCASRTARRPSSTSARPSRCSKARASRSRSRLRVRALDENALVLLVGQALPADLPPGLPLDQQQIPIELPAGLPSDLLARRPDMRAAEQQLVAANANIGAARAAFFPRISLTAQPRHREHASSRTCSRADRGRSPERRSCCSRSSTAGRNQANLEFARASRDIAVAQYERSIQTAFREVADALAGRATLGDQLRAQAAQVNAFAIAYRLADLRYRSGASSYFDALDAQRSLFAAQLLLVQTQQLQLQNLVTLYRALGGGWNESAELAAGTTPEIPPPH